LVIAGWLWFAGLFLLDVGSLKRDILAAKTWSKRGDLCGGCGSFAGSFRFEFWLVGRERKALTERLIE
jgi:hypothetical protein